MIPFPEGTADFFLLQSVLTCPGAHSISYSMCIRGSLLGQNGQSMKLNYSPLSRAKGKSAWGYTSAPLCAFMPDLLLNQ